MCNLPKIDMFTLLYKQIRPMSIISYSVSHFCRIIPLTPGKPRQYALQSRQTCRMCINLSLFIRNMVILPIEFSGNSEYDMNNMQE